VSVNLGRALCHKYKKEAVFPPFSRNLTKPREHSAPRARTRSIGTREIVRLVDNNEYWVAIVGCATTLHSVKPQVTS
jgi:hypothetical protein